MKIHSRNGFTLLELIIVIVLIALIMVFLQATVSSITDNAARVETTTVAVLLAEEKLEEIFVRKSVPRGFDEVQDVLATPFEDPFSHYSYSIQTHNLNYNGLTFTEAGAGATTDYKKVTVIVTRAGAAEDAARLSTVIGRYGELPP